MKTAIVVGAGVAGLQAARALLKRDFGVTILEQGSSVGGVWRKAYRDSNLKVPFKCYEFGEHPWPENLPDSSHPSAATVRSYVKQYAERFGLLDHVQFGCRVSHITPSSEGSWYVSYIKTDGLTSELNITSTDYVVICTGFLSNPYVPTYKDSQAFMGQQLHASSFPSPSVVDGKQVVVIGGCRTDIECPTLDMLASRAAAVTCVFRQVPWPTPHQLRSGVPLQRQLLSHQVERLLPPYYTAGRLQRALARLLRPLQTMSWTDLERDIAQQFGLQGAMAPPASLQEDLLHSSQAFGITWQGSVDQMVVQCDSSHKQGDNQKWGSGLLGDRWAKYTDGEKGGSADSSASAAALKQSIELVTASRASRASSASSRRPSMNWQESASKSRRLRGSSTGSVLSSTASHHGSMTSSQVQLEGAGDSFTSGRFPKTAAAAAAAVSARSSFTDPYSHRPSLCIDLPGMPNLTTSPPASPQAQRHSPKLIGDTAEWTTDRRAEGISSGSPAAAAQEAAAGNLHRSRSAPRRNYTTGRLDELVHTYRRSSSHQNMAALHILPEAEQGTSCQTRSPQVSPKGSRHPPGHLGDIPVSSRVTSFDSKACSLKSMEGTAAEHDLPCRSATRSRQHSMLEPAMPPTRLRRSSTLETSHFDGAAAAEPRTDVGSERLQVEGARNSFRSSHFSLTPAATARPSTLDRSSRRISMTLDQPTASSLSASAPGSPHTPRHLPQHVGDTQGNPARSHASSFSYKSSARNLDAATVEGSKRRPGPRRNCTASYLDELYSKGSRSALASVHGSSEFEPSAPHLNKLQSSGQHRQLQESRQTTSRQLSSSSAQVVGQRQPQLPGSMLAVRGDVSHFTPSGITLTTGQHLSADVVLYCTGFVSNYEYLSGSIKDQLGLQKDGLYLYRSVLPPRVPNLAFVGSETSSYNALLTAGLQAEWLAAHWAGAVQLPPASAMQQDVEKQMRWRRKVMPVHKTRGAAVQLYMSQYHAQLMQDLGLKAPCGPLCKRSRLLAAAAYNAAFVLSGVRAAAASLVAKQQKAPAAGHTKAPVEPYDSNTGCEVTTKVGAPTQQQDRPVSSIASSSNRSSLQMPEEALGQDGAAAKAEQAPGSPRCRSLTQQRSNLMHSSSSLEPVGYFGYTVPTNYQLAVQSQLYAANDGTLPMAQAGDKTQPAGPASCQQAGTAFAACADQGAAAGDAAAAGQPGAARLAQSPRTPEPDVQLRPTSNHQPTGAGLSGGAQEGAGSNGIMTRDVPPDMKLAGSCWVAVDPVARRQGLPAKNLCGWLQHNLPMLEVVGAKGSAAAAQAPAAAGAGFKDGELEWNAVAADDELVREMELARLRVHWWLENHGTSVG